MLQSLYVSQHSCFYLTNKTSRLGDDVVIKLKWGNTEYHGRLKSVDSYMNIQLTGTEEFIDGKSTGNLGEVLIRCNNVLWISGANGSSKADVDMKD
jgi:small nuclear ribonucleoprotein F